MSPALKPPTFKEERQLWAQGYRAIAGIDEAGRGPLAGPVVAGATILPRRCRASWLGLVRDSKVLMPGVREEIFEAIRRDRIPFGVGIVSHKAIDEHGIVPSIRLAMYIAVTQLPQPPDFLLIDYLSLPEIEIPQKGIVDGDALCLSIAAASVVAKVTRDHLMVQFDRQFPGYGMAQHKGYYTPEHVKVLQQIGPCPIHRRSFDPVRTLNESPGIQISLDELTAGLPGPEMD